MRGDRRGMSQELNTHVLMLSFKSQDPHRVTTKYVLGFFVITSERLRDSSVVRIDAVPLLGVFLQRWEEWVIGTCFMLTPHIPHNRLTNLPNSNRSEPDASSAAFRPTSE
jgi:hypothetical protein